MHWLGDMLRPIVCDLVECDGGIWTCPSAAQGLGRMHLLCCLCALCVVRSPIDVELYRHNCAISAHRASNALRDVDPPIAGERHRCNSGQLDRVRVVHKCLYLVDIYFVKRRVCPLRP